MSGQSGCALQPPTHLCNRTAHALLADPSPSTTNSAMLFTLPFTLFTYFTSLRALYKKAQLVFKQFLELKEIYILLVGEVNVLYIPISNCLLERPKSKCLK